MSKSFVAVALTMGFVLVGAVLARSPQGDKDQRARIAKQQLEMIEVAFEDLKRLGDGGEVLPDDPRFSLWSRRRVEARRELGGPKADLIAALEEHLELARRIVKVTESARDSGRATRVDLQDARYRALEAELWLVKARDE